jgi:hypothetical protein
MKIGIVTFWLSEVNYGQQMQCYALQKHLKNLGHEPFLIRYSQNDGIWYKDKLYKRLLRYLNPQKAIKITKYIIKTITQPRKVKQELAAHPRFFEQFRNKNIVQSSKIWLSSQDLIEDPPDADIYIVGSDQVWRPLLITRQIDRKKMYLTAFFLAFGGKNKKRIAYSASFGTEEVSSAYIKDISPLLKELNYISVREKSALKILELCGIHNGEWTPDPVFLLRSEDYRKLYKNANSAPAAKYCLFYILDLENEINIKKLFIWSKKNGWENIIISGNLPSPKYANCYPAIDEWLKFLDKAEYIITNSFHGTAFSLIFNKKFAVIPNKGSAAENLNTRIDSLFEMFEISPRWIKKGDFSVLDKEIDSLKITQTLDKIERWKTPYFNKILKN